MIFYESKFIPSRLSVILSTSPTPFVVPSVKTMEELTAVLNQAIKDQMENNKTTLIEVMLNQELGEPFRRDAMKKPVQVAGVAAADMAAE